MPPDFDDFIESAKKASLTPDEREKIFKNLISAAKKVKLKPTEKTELKDKIIFSAQSQLVKSYDTNRHSPSMAPLTQTFVDAAQAFSLTSDEKSELKQNILDFMEHNPKQQAESKSSFSNMIMSELDSSATQG